MRSGRSAKFLKALRRKYGLGEYRRKAAGSYARYYRPLPLRRAFVSRRSDMPRSRREAARRADLPLQVEEMTKAYARKACGKPRATGPHIPCPKLLRQKGLRVPALKLGFNPL